MKDPLGHWYEGARWRVPRTPTPVATDYRPGFWDRFFCWLLWGLRWVPVKPGRETAAKAES